MSIKLVIGIYHLQQLLKAGHDNIVATLIGAGADVNKAGHWYYTSYSSCLRQAMIILLLHSLVLVLMSIKLMVLHVYLLQQLLEAGHDNIVATLIDAGANVNKAGHWDTPLIAAAEGRP